jgi:hypothetical protein
MSPVDGNGDTAEAAFLPKPLPSLQGPSSLLMPLVGPVQCPLMGLLVPPASVMFFLLYCAHLMDYHWDCHRYFVITLSRTDYDSSLLPIVTHTSTPTSSIWLVTWTDSLLVLLLVVSVAFQVPVLVVSAWRLVVLKPVPVGT